MRPYELDSTTSRAQTKDFKDYDRFVAQLAKAIQDEASAIEFYGVLEGMAPAAYRDFVTHAKNDETTHLRLLSKLYRRLTGREPSAQAQFPQFTTFKDGVETAFRQELDAAELYRDMYLSTRVHKIRDILFRIMTDEMEHAQRFTFLYGLA